MTGSSFTLCSHEDQTSREYFHHSSGQRINTDAVVVEALRKQYPHLHLIVAPAINLDLLEYASAGFATAKPIEDPQNDPVYGSTLSWRMFRPSPRRLDNQPGSFSNQVLFGKYMYRWKDLEFLLYIVNGRDGTWPVVCHYILTREDDKANELIKEAVIWGSQLHDEVWVFDQYWQKSRELWESVQKSHWSNVILEESMKKAIIADVDNFFDGRATYAKLKVPWKRGIIYHGPPGNGKTISIKAMMNALYQRGKGDDPRQSVPTLYVKTLTSYAGPEYSLKQIFTKARQEAPCYLVFEDLDSIVSDRVRSYFLNEVDGLKSNDGILMVGSTNHLDRLDPGISKRPSRFDRKYYFPDPEFAQRVLYARFWQGKLSGNEELVFPDRMCEAVARITDGFSFAYIQEAFVASLLAIAAKDARLKGEEGDGDGDDGLEKLVLWRELKKQVRILREEMGNGDDEGGEAEVPAVGADSGLRGERNGDDRQSFIPTAPEDGTGRNIRGEAPEARPTNDIPLQQHGLGIPELVYNLGRLMQDVERAVERGRSFGRP